MTTQSPGKETGPPRQTLRPVHPETHEAAAAHNNQARPRSAIPNTGPLAAWNELWRDTPEHPPVSVMALAIPAQALLKSQARFVLHNIRFARPRHAIEGPLRCKLTGGGEPRNRAQTLACQTQAGEFVLTACLGSPGANQGPNKGPDLPSTPASSLNNPEPHEAHQGRLLAASPDPNWQAALPDFAHSFEAGPGLVRIGLSLPERSLNPSLFWARLIAAMLAGINAATPASERQSDRWLLPRTIERFAMDSSSRGPVCELLVTRDRGTVFHVSGLTAEGCEVFRLQSVAAAVAPRGRTDSPAAVSFPTPVTEAAE